MADLEQQARDAMIASLSRIETSTKYLADDVKELKTDFKKEITEVRTLIDAKFVTKDEFAPVKALVYGLVGSVLLCVLGAMLLLVVKRP